MTHSPRRRIRMLRWSATTVGMFVLLGGLGWWGYRAHPTPSTPSSVSPIRTVTVVDPDPPPPKPPIITPAATPQPAPKQAWNVPILMYHYVRVVDPSQDQLGFNLSVTKEQLTAQLDYLANHGFHTIDPTELIKADAALPDKPIALTFDDGYEDFYTTAWPILRAHRMTAVEYIVSGFLDHDRYLTTTQLKEMVGQGLVVGAHSIDHVDLSAQTPDRLKHELVDPKTILEGIVGHPIPLLAYPSGRYNAAVIAAAKNAGYTQAVTTNYDFATNLDDSLQLPRIRISGGDSLATFIDKVEGRSSKPLPAAKP